MADSKKVSDNFLTLLDSLQTKTTDTQFKKRVNNKYDENNSFSGVKKKKQVDLPDSTFTRAIKNQAIDKELSDNNQGNGKKYHKDSRRGNFVEKGFERKDKNKRDGNEKFKTRGHSHFESKCTEASSRIESEHFKSEVKRPKVMGYKVLENLLTEETYNVVTTLANAKSGFQDLCNTRPLRPDLLILIVRVLNKVNESNVHSLKVQVLSETFKPEFIDEVKKYVCQICIEDNKQRLEILPVFYRNILELFESVINFFPSIINEKLKSVLNALSLSMKNAKSEQGIDIKESLFEILNSITEQVDSSLEDKKKMDREQHRNILKNVPAPNNFREMLLVPTKEDFMCQRAFLRPNIVKGSYSDCEQYLDIQFRLLREDFIAPLREGIHEYIESLSAPHLKHKYSNVRIYPKVQFLDHCKSRNALGFLIRFDCDHKIPARTNWEYNKRFMVGSLLLFSDDDFQTFYLATVADRNISNLQNGLLSVTFISESPEHLFEPGVFFVMAESEVYYEAYRPVLYALQRMSEKNFPMKQYIVDVDTACLPPKYMIENSTYTLSGFKVNLLNEEEWPSSEELKMNPSQHQAFKSALTNDFVVIQGPPGTGKTFLALKITEALLRNKVSTSTPIVVICYTNHALDQFLEGILKHTKNLIRIGSQSQNEVIDQFSIDKVRSEKRKAGTLKSSQLYWDTLHEKKELLDAINQIGSKIEELNSFKGIVNLSVLKTVVIPQHFNNLKDQEIDWLLFRDFPDIILEDGALNLASPGELDITQIPEQSTDMFENVTEFVNVEEFEEEMDDDENAKRLADIVQDELIDDFDFASNQHFFSTVTYSFEHTEIMQTIEYLRNQIRECFISHPPSRFYFQKEKEDEIQEISWMLKFIQKQLAKFKHLKINLEKFQKLQNTSNIWEVKPQDRWELYITWIHLYCCQLKQTIQHLTIKHQNVLMKFNDLKQLEDLAFVQNAAVIGLTTSGAAKRRVLLENLNTKIVIVEEAAEVLEAHIVSSLTISVQHVILIGDHKQLKPNPAVYKLAKKFNMDLSLFERMLNNGLGCSSLNIQHRMRPEIASLVSPTIYPSLSNHPTTFDRPKISGIDKFMFFLTHNHPEDQLPDSTSRQNKFEADFLIQLCQYLLLQGYPAERITILATYTGQVWYMRKEKRILSLKNPDWRNVRITPVDNFQGEENHIILLSLVRSNKEAKIGFLSTENRVCVALSRARDGLYIVGNMDNFTESSSIWPKVKKQLEEINAVGRHLMIRCERHPDQVTAVSCAKDFLAAPEGGCSLKCEFPLSCGHVCPQMCHIIDREHAFFRCQMPCERPPCEVEGHRCPLKCFEPCKPCVTRVEKQLPCSHSAKLACHEEPAAAKCWQRVPVILPDCNHSIMKLCYMDINQCSCKEKCDSRLPCGHACELKCHINKDPQHLEYLCRKDCPRPNAKCRRNHPCPKRCFEECGDCSVKVLTDLPCGHRQGIPCSQDASSVNCAKPCTKLLPCTHKCLLECWVPCNPEMCKVLVTKEGPCGHTFKNVKCTQSTDGLKCKEPCNRNLNCGHACTQLCYLDCTKVLCQESVLSVVAPACGHPPLQLPCHINKPGLDPGSDELLQLCQEPCDKRLGCGHICKGNCCTCLSGRLHVPCKEKCNKRLICGHRCGASCSELCPPCQSKDCFQSCNHFKCNKKHPCSKLCEPCTKPCMWSCEHQRCTRQCGMECNRLKCDEPCTLELECGHLCTGFCGEICPPLCRVCNVDDLQITHDPTVRFVVLEDCGHTVESTQLDIDANAVDSNRVVRLLECPECSTPIVKTKRYRNIYIRLRSQLRTVDQSINQEKVHLRKILLENKHLLKSDPTSSPLMNCILSNCLDQKLGKGGDWSNLVIGCLLLPLAKVCQQNKLWAKHSFSNLRSLSAEEELRLKLRLEYLATALQLRHRHISYQDILQVELEVARVLRAMANRQLLYLWYKVKSYTWEEDNNVLKMYGFQPIEKLSSTLKTRDFEKEWRYCTKNHFFVSNSTEDCDICLKEAEQEQKKHNVKWHPEEPSSNQPSRHYDALGRHFSSFPRHMTYNHPHFLNEHVQNAPVTDFRRMNTRRGRGRGEGNRGRGRGQTPRYKN